MIGLNNHNKVSIPIPLLILITEITLGGLGRICYFPIRYIIFGVVFVLAIYKWNRYKITLDKDSIMFGLFILSFVIYGVIVALIQENSKGMIISDITNFFAIIYIYIILVYSEYREDILHKIIKLFVNLTVILSAITILIFIWSYFAKFFKIDALLVFNTIESKLNYGFISGWLYNNQFSRVYLPNGVYMQIALAIVLQQLIVYKDHYKSKDLIVKLCILIGGILASGTRGYWLGAGIVLIVTLITLRNEEKNKYIKLMGLLAITGLIVFILLPQKQEIINRFLSITDFSGDISNNIRKIQLKHMMDQFWKNPIFGSGFGYNLPAYAEITGHSGLNFELYYIELLYKTGTMGMTFLLLGTIYFLILKPYKLFIQNISKNDRVILSGWFVGTISVIFISASNPYLSGNYGLFILAMMIVIISTLERKYK
ncbi:Lipid A core-O-antigen ligase and related enzymes [[Clostridium] sordellii]|uniref:O-antigen ligase family protein n=1 Tax=Paraclostridium sordellii TaxID=1505 RepID=UPI0005E7F80E|nr:O-antigen ligase family protein [Paeniclostridium sordellii]CEQ10463.1 Lipid A core-O-antigen ligase and related enzymes [[Clostridium] sordellii] [Paeniclostridium sordellii]